MHHTNTVVTNQSKTTRIPLLKKVQHAQTKVCFFYFSHLSLEQLLYTRHKGEIIKKSHDDVKRSSLF